MREKKFAFIFTFQDGLSWYIHALHCYLVHDIVLNFDDDGNLRTTKSIQKVMKSEVDNIKLSQQGLSVGSLRVLWCTEGAAQGEAGIR